MGTYVIATSSLYPIDLLAGIYALILQPDARVEVFLNTAAELPISASSRRHVARAALPLLRWEFDTGGVWRQDHLPLEGLGTDDQCRAVMNVGGQIAALLNSAGFERSALEVASRAKRLSGQARARITERTPSDWFDAAAGLIQCIYRDTTGADVIVSRYDEYRTGAKGGPELRNLFGRMVADAPPTTVRRFTRGGYFEAYLSDRQMWVRFNGFGTRNGRLVLFEPAASEQPAQPIEDRFSVEVGSADVSGLRVGGPLELGVLQELGSLAHLPWYSEAVFSEAPERRYSGLETISPISSTSLARVAHSAGGQGWRLRPTGYSLLEWDAAVIMDLAAALLNVPSIVPDDLRDWRDLAYEFPRVDQKLSKHQGSVRAFVEFRLRQVQSNIESGILSHLERLGRLSSPLLYGLELIGAAAILSLTKEWGLPSSPKTPAPELSRWFRERGWLSATGELDTIPLLRAIDRILLTSRSWLRSVGLPPEEWNAVSREFEIGFNFAQEVGPRRIEHIDPFAPRDPGGLGYLVRALRAAAENYYKFVSFCVGSIFKANILSAYLLLGGEELRECILWTLETRGERRAFWYRPVLWE